VFEFGDFRLDGRRRLLSHRDGAAVSLTAKAFDTLVYLVEHEGIVLPKDELMRALWADTVVEENNLNQNISILRRALGEHRGDHRYIATVPGRGYQFVAKVRIAEESPAQREPTAGASMAVLPFVNVSGDPEFDFFGDFYESGQFGVAPTARISVLKRKDARDYKLKAQIISGDITVPTAP
jgi:DNA-binding winged helix-turn-helix (wHTH) protein